MADLCRKCGVDMDRWGKLHPCNPGKATAARHAPAPVTGKRRGAPKSTSRPVTVTPRDGAASRPVVDKRCPLCGAAGWCGPKSAAERQKDSRARRAQKT